MGRILIDIFCGYSYCGKTMKIFLAVLFVQFCLVLSKPISKEEELKVIDDNAPTADATKAEKSAHHNFVAKQVDSKKEKDENLDKRIEKPKETAKETAKDSKVPSAEAV